MSKTTNKKQLEMLLDAMQTHPGIACGMYKGSKEELNRFWRNLEAELNSAGPPQKSVSEWKKVWCDQKKYVRQKAGQNLKSSKGTGGGPNMEQKFSGIEEAIYNLVGMKESVEGVADKFGLGGYYKNTNKQTETNIENILEEILVADDDSNEIQKECPSQPPAKKIKKTPIGLPPQVSSADILAEEIGIQKNMLQVMKEQQQTTKKIYRSIDRLYDLKKEELQEQKRHNLVMEKLRLTEVQDKIEKNRRLLELENLKYNVNQKR
ncbi:uncharacterized protein LOC135962375 [Calliphora vicina]|uniref:uncharacterized protein LOC135962375 n=1 Tax=Calliphora vicina TaxID=7373 RepID=UPI00325AD84C